MHYLITGGTGFIGRNFIQSLNLSEDSVTVLSRQKISIINCSVIQSLQELSVDTKIDVIINLAGSRIDRRWSKATKQDLLSSRINTTKDLVSFVSKLKNKPQVFIQASAIGYYGDYSNQELNENSKAKKSFTNHICEEWESLAKQVTAHGIRLCITRFAVVLGENGGFIQKVQLPFKLSLGGKLGDGHQDFSWIHIDDVIKGFKHLIADAKCQGVYNFASPNSVTNLELTKSLGKALKVPTIFSMPAFIVKIIFGEMGEELLLKGNRIVPQNLIKSGYNFKYSKLDAALQSIFA